MKTLASMIILSKFWHNISKEISDMINYELFNGKASLVVMRSTFLEKVVATPC
jgi:hypothetical protein